MFIPPIKIDLVIVIHRPKGQAAKRFLHAEGRRKRRHRPPPPRRVAAVSAHKAHDFEDTTSRPQRRRQSDNMDSSNAQHPWWFMVKNAGFKVKNSGETWGLLKDDVESQWPMREFLHGFEIEKVALNLADSGYHIQT